MLNDIFPHRLRWEEPNKKRYYQIFLSRDLLNDWVVTKSYGSLQNAMGKVTHIACPSLEDAKKLIDQITRTREKRGYVLVK